MAFSAKKGFSGLIFFNDEEGEKTNEFLRFLENKENQSAIQFLLENNPSPYLFMAGIRELYDAIDPKLLNSFLMEAVVVTKERWLVALVMRIINLVNENSLSVVTLEDLNQLIKFILPYSDSSQISNLLNNLKFNEASLSTRKAIVSYYNSTSPDQKSHLLSLIIQQYDAVLLKMLAREVQFREIINSLKTEEAAIATVLLEMKDDDFPWFINLMRQFINGFGNIEFNGGLLTLAQTRARKAYEFNPVILNKSEFKEYLAILRESPHPLRERFVIAGGHWIVGDIKIDEKGHVSVLFLDSLSIERISEFFTEKAIIEFARLFPDATIYYVDIKRQYSTLGCSVFALDDVRHLYTVEDGHLEEKYNLSGLHGYLADSAKVLSSKEEYKPIVIQDYDGIGKYTVTLCALPLSLMRTMQSRALTNWVITDRSEAERKVPVNKKREIMTPEYAEQTFFRDAGSAKRINIRLEETLKKIARYNFEFLKNRDSKTVNEETEPFTLKGFKKRIALKKALKFTKS
ncbi:MAG: YopJ family acetyltransferase [Gammaproteobacteria bacterium]